MPLQEVRPRKYAVEYWCICATFPPLMGTLLTSAHPTRRESAAAPTAATWPWKTTENGSLFSTALSTSLPSQALFPLQCPIQHTHTHTRARTHSSFSRGTGRCTMCIIEIDPVIQLHTPEKQQSPRCGCTLTEGITRAGERHQCAHTCTILLQNPKRTEILSVTRSLEESLFSLIKNRGELD